MTAPEPSGPGWAGPDEHDLIIPLSELTDPTDLYAALMGGAVIDLEA